MLFHLGVLWRLNEAGWLRRIDEVSSVSGGSIAAGVLALAWPRLSFNDRGVAPDFASEVAAPLRALASRRIDRPAALVGMLLPGRTAGGRVAAAYRRELFGRATLQDLPSRPWFVFNATNVASGALVRVSKRYLADWRVGRIDRPELELAEIIACSSAFPGWLGPHRLQLGDQTWITDKGNDLTGPEYRSQLLLSDGGVYDNLGIETVWKRCDTLIVSDAAVQRDPVAGRPRGKTRQLIRAFQVIDSQVRTLRVRQAITAFQRGDRQGLYFSIRSDIARYPAPGQLPAPVEQTRELARLPTRLAPLAPRVQERLVNWGYAICDAGLRRRVDGTISPPLGYPYPEAGVR